MNPEPKNHENPQDQPPDKTREKEPYVGYLGDLLHRSTGLPTNQPAPLPREKSPWAYAGLGLQFAGTTAIFAFMGLYLDHRFGWSPWGTISLTMLGVIGGLYLLIKDSLKENRDQDQKP